MIEAADYAAAVTERLLDEFEACWRSSSPPDLAPFFARVAASNLDEPAQRNLLAELVAIDLWCRWRRFAAEPLADESLGCDEPTRTLVQLLPARPLLADYVRLFPQLGPLGDLPAALIAEEYRARRRWGGGANHEEYLERFARQRSELEWRLRDIDDQAAEATFTASRETVRHVPRGGPVSLSSRAAEEPEVPATIGKYRVIGLLDSGGQALVYRAVHPTLARELVIKISRSPVAEPSASIDRLVPEGKMLSSLEHPHIARVYDLDVHEGRPFLVLEYVRGLTLRQYIEQHPLAPREMAALLARIARALAAAHALGIVHRDLKPQNILIDEAGEPRIIDFGLAQLRDAWLHDTDLSGVISGTAQYMAPEQARGEDEAIGHRSDLFALGGILYFLLTGQAPFAGGDIHDSIDRAARCAFDADALERSGAPRALAAICLRAMQADPKDRHSNAAALAGDLERFARRSWVKPWLIAAGVLALAAVSAILAVLLNGGSNENNPPRPLRHDFPLSIKVLGSEAGADGVLRLVEGQPIRFSVTAGHDAYVGIWWTDNPQGRYELLFPNAAYEVDHFFGAGQARTVPGDPGDAIIATPSSGTEYFHIVATSFPWPLKAGEELGPGVALASEEELARWANDERGFEWKRGQAAPVSEQWLPLEVHRRE